MWTTVRGVAVAAVVLVLTAASAAAAPPAPPAISEPAPGGAKLNPADVHMEASFSDPDGHGHAVSDWEIWTDAPNEPAWRAHGASGSEKAHIHLGDGVFVGAHAGRTALEHDTDYRLRVRFRDDNGEWSAWATRSFTTSRAGTAGKDAAVPWNARAGFAVEVFASGLQLPVDIALVPDAGDHPGDPLLYVAELYGAIKVVTRDGTVKDYATDLLNFNPTGDFPGSGEQGVGGLAVDPGSGDVFATLVYEDEGAVESPKPHYPKVVRFHSADGGLSAAGQQTVLDMHGEAQGASHQISSLTISPDGDLYVHNGDGNQPATARNLHSYRGKVLRMSLEGKALADNPFYDDSDGIDARDYVFASGLRNPFGGDWRRADSSLYTVENGPTTDRFARVARGRDFLWAGSNATMSEFARYNWTPSHAPVGIAFVQRATAGGSGFPHDSMGSAFVTESGATYASGPQDNGKRIVEFALRKDGGLASGPTNLVEYSGTGKATVSGIAAGPDGLYFADLYKDQDYASPIDRGANLLRVRHDPVRPAIRRYRMLRGAFAVGQRPTRPRAAARPKWGTAFVYRSSEPATVRIAIRRTSHGFRVRGRCRGRSTALVRRVRRGARLPRCLLPGSRGVRVGEKCVAPTSQALRRASRRPVGIRRCALRGLRGRLTRQARPGPNRTPFSGRVGRRPLRPGYYAATIRARDAAGNLSRPRTVPFRVVRRR